MKTVILSILLLSAAEPLLAGDVSAGANGTISDAERPILIYSNRKGLYGGAVIKGGAVEPDDKGNRVYYSQYLSMKDILFDKTLQIRAKADFEAPLAAQGTWLEVKSYGHCWRPACVAAGWRPYCNGRWIWTDCGWYWQSDEPWGWACYHYGYWVEDPNVGWVWVPDVEWGPAWVSWRYGGGFAGWAPLPPPRFFIFAREAAPSQFAFVAAAHFSDPIRPRMLIVNNIYIINMATQTFNVSKEFRVMDGTRRKVVINNGPGVEAIQRATGRNFAAVSIEEAARRARVPSGPGRKLMTVEAGRQRPFPSGCSLSGRAPEAVEKSNPAGALSSPGATDRPPMQRRLARGSPGHPEKR